MGGTAGLTAAAPSTAGQGDARAGQRRCGGARINQAGGGSWGPRPGGEMGDELAGHVVGSAGARWESAPATAAAAADGSRAGAP